LITSFGALSGKTFALLRLGDLGEVLRIVRAGKESFEENRTRWRLLHVREAWIRLLAFDYQGALNLYESISDDRDQWAVQPRAICEMAEGYMAEQQKDFPRALTHFSRVYQLDSGTKFFLSWLWRINAHLELGNVWLRSGETTKSKSASESILKSALSVADPHIQVLALELAARVFMAESEMPRAQEHIENAIRLAEQYEIPLAAWRAYATASEIFRARERTAGATVLFS
jgi:tetratricopeptide (TPR) repeat protein